MSLFFVIHKQKGKRAVDTILVFTQVTETLSHAPQTR